MTVEPAPERPPWARAVKALAVIGAVVLAWVAVVGGARYLGRQVGTAVSPDEPGGERVVVEPGRPVTIEVKPGASGQDIAAMLTAQGVVQSAVEFEAAVRNVEAAERLQAGSYDFVTLMDPREVVAMLVAGPEPAVYRLTIIEGLRVEEILVSLAESTPHGYSDFEEALLGGDVSTSLREIPERASLAYWEGLLFPDTYEFSESARPAPILQRMASTMEQRVHSVDWSAWEELGHTEYEGLVLASLIEAEARIEAERPMISSVIHNRLAEGIKLDIDATVLYALGTRDPDRFDKTTDSPYNTYAAAGLPPTPIAAPGRASLEAAAHPAETPFFYYVLSNLEGAHAFAETLEEHNINVAKAKEDGVLP